MLSRTPVRVVLAGCAAVLLTAAAASAQEQPTEFQSWRLPGWTFTPGVVFGGLYDTNVALSSPTVDGRTASDKLFQLQPFGQLEFFSPRTMFSSGYQGALRRYVSFDELNDTEHRGYLSLRHLITRRLTYFLTDSFLQAPTTDKLELNGVPFLRTGSRYNSAATGIEARVTRSVDFTARYDLTWVDFDRKDTPMLTGGYVNGVRGSLSRRFNDRASLGGEYGIRLANLDRGLRNLAFQEAGGVFRYRTGPQTTLEAAFGYAHLTDRNRDITRDGPYARVGLTYRADRVNVGAEFERSYVPSLTFGGANQSQEVRGYIQMPLTRNRLYVQESAAWRRTDPFIEAELPLDATWAQTTIGYALARWLRIEGYHSFTRQDTRVTAGQINRQIVGMQFVVSEPMRIR